ncbi:MAG TPA: mannosyltransferase family protein [Actinocrinis sp.]|nr:mannosyltransferase family protein [Actinocrinis sp.]
MISDVIDALGTAERPSTEVHGSGRAPGRWRRARWRRVPRWLWEGLRATLPAWVAARVLVCAVSWYQDPAHPLGKLLSWDTQWYLGIAEHGYDHGGTLIHFFPLTSLCAAALAAVTRLPTNIALFVFCWAMALLFGALVHRVVVRETGDQAAARRAAWLTQLAPGAYALVMGYTEPLAGVLAVGYFLAVRGISSSISTGTRPDTGGNARRLWVAAGLGFFGGMARPVGLLLAIPGSIEGLQQARHEGWNWKAASRAVVIAAAPVAGLAAFLAYSRVQYSSWLLPYTQQTSARGRGAIMGNPISILHHVWVHNWHGHGHGAAVMACVPILGFAALLPIVWRRLPIAYAAWTIPSFVLAIGSKDFTSLPRYLGALFPCLIAAALVTRRRWQWAAMLAVNCALLLWATYYVFAVYIVP